MECSVLSNVAIDEGDPSRGFQRFVNRGSFVFFSAPAAIDEGDTPLGFRHFVDRGSFVYGGRRRILKRSAAEKV